MLKEYEITIDETLRHKFFVTVRDPKDAIEAAISRLNNLIRCEKDTVKQTSFEVVLLEKLCQVKP